MFGPDVEVKVLDARLQTWGLPRYQSEQAAGIDLIACLDAPLEIHPQAPAQLISTGLALHMNSAGFCAVIVPRSGAT
ncbi:MAG: hypothetical protein RL260_1271 [Pseudomonadota bacterium]